MSHKLLMNQLRPSRLSALNIFKVYLNSLGHVSAPYTNVFKALSQQVLRSWRMFKETMDSLKDNCLPPMCLMLCLSILLLSYSAFLRTVNSLHSIALFLLLPLNLTLSTSFSLTYPPHHKSFSSVLCPTSVILILL